MQGFNVHVRNRVTRPFLAVVALMLVLGVAQLSVEGAAQKRWIMTRPLQQDARADLRFVTGW